MDSEPSLPIAISWIGSKYLIFDITAVTWLRSTHHVCGLTTGTLPQAPSQNLFLGLPVHIMPEEAQLLVEKGVAYILDDAQAHKQVLQDNDTSRQAAYLSNIRGKGQQVSIARREEKEEIKRQSLKQAKTNQKSKSKSTSKQTLTPLSACTTDEQTESTESSWPSHTEKNSSDDLLFDSSTTAAAKPEHRAPPTMTTATLATVPELQPHNIVPTTSDLWLPPLPSNSTNDEVTPSLLSNSPPPASYALYRHLHAKSYFMTPGLRFGCQYCVYPGDPLRFHSHFLATAVAWDEEIDLMKLISGGRLGTGVKKGFLIGGPEEEEEEEKGEKGEKIGEKTKERTVRTLSIEWAAM